MIKKDVRKSFDNNKVLFIPAVLHSLGVLWNKLE